MGPGCCVDDLVVKVISKCNLYHSCLYTVYLLHAIDTIGSMLQAAYSNYRLLHASPSCCAWRCSLQGKE
jgi:hypothetical protein